MKQLRVWRLWSRLDIRSLGFLAIVITGVISRGASADVAPNSTPIYLTKDEIYLCDGQPGYAIPECYITCGTEGQNTLNVQRIEKLTMSRIIYGIQNSSGNPNGTSPNLSITRSTELNIEYVNGSKFDKTYAFLDGEISCTLNRLCHQGETCSYFPH